MNELVSKVVPKGERTALIATATAAAIRKTPVPFRGTYAEAPVISLPIAVPVYRADNGRLGALETGYVREHDLASTHFQDKQEEPETQNILHGFLSALAERPDGPIKQELSRIATQTEPLLVTVDGVVINGNRRLAAMRDLLATDAGRYASFQSVEVAVLPAEATPADIEMIEAILQMAPETKLAYGWIDRRLKLRFQLDVLELPAADIVEHYRLSDASQIERELTELKLAEEYLNDFLRTPQAYAAIDWAEEPFEQLAQRLEFYAEPTNRAVFQLVGFCLIQAATTDEKLRPLRTFPFVPPQPGYLQNLLQHRLGSELNLWPARSDEQSFDALKTDDRLKLIEVLGAGEHVAERASVILKIVNDIIDEFKSAPNPQFIVQRLRQITRMATRIDLRQLTPTQREQIAQELQRIAGLFTIAAEDQQPPASRGILANVAQSLEKTGKSILRDIRGTQPK